MESEEREEMEGEKEKRERYSGEEGRESVKGMEKRGWWVREYEGFGVRKWRREREKVVERGKGEEQVEKEGKGK